MSDIVKNKSIEAGGIMDKVIYRKYRNGEIIALFPGVSADIAGHCCGSYMHIGQHGAANPQTIFNHTAPAKPAEYAELHEELERMCYNPKVIKRFSQKDFKIRKAQYR